MSMAARKASSARGRSPCALSTSPIRSWLTERSRCHWAFPVSAAARRARMSMAARKASSARGRSPCALSTSPILSWLMERSRSGPAASGCSATRCSSTTRPARYDSSAGPVAPSVSRASPRADRATLLSGNPRSPASLPSMSVRPSQAMSSVQANCACRLSTTDARRDEIVGQPADAASRVCSTSALCCSSSLGNSARVKPSSSAVSGRDRNRAHSTSARRRPPRAASTTYSAPDFVRSVNQSRNEAWNGVTPSACSSNRLPRPCSNLASVGVSQPNIGFSRSTGSGRLAATSTSMRGAKSARYTARSGNWRRNHRRYRPVSPCGNWSGASRSRWNSSTASRSLRRYMKLPSAAVTTRTIRASASAGARSGVASQPRA